MAPTEVRLRARWGGSYWQIRGRKRVTWSVPSSVPSGSLWSRTVPTSPVPGEGSRHFCPHCILSKNTVQSNTGRSKALLSQRRDGARSASHSGCGSPREVRPLSVVDTGQLAYGDSSVPPWKEPVPSRGGQVQHCCWPGAMRHTCFRKRAPTVPEAGKDNPTQRGRPGAGGAGPFS